jgi:putative sporulation protein YtxC
MKELKVSVGLELQNIHEEILRNFTNAEYPEVSLSADGAIKILLNDDDTQYVEYTAEILSNYIFTVIEPQLIKDEVELECVGLPEVDADNIAERSIWKILQSSEEANERRIQEIKEDIVDGFNSHGTFNLAGYLHFKFFMRKLEIMEYVNIVIEEFFNDGANDQFATLINQFISLKKPKTGMIHVVLKNDDEFELITDNLEKIDLGEIDDLAEDAEVDRDMIESWHLILSTLMTFAPESIIVHTSEKINPYISQMLARVYGERAAVCYGCDFCEAIRETSEEE